MCHKLFNKTQTILKQFDVFSMIVCVAHRILVLMVRSN